MSVDAFKLIEKKLGVSFEDVRVVDPYRHVRLAGRLGAHARYRLYGNPGTVDGRRKGGRTASAIFARNPQYVRDLGFKIRKEVVTPPYSSRLAEFIGIVLGDGHVSRYQVRIYFDSRNEKPLATYVQRSIRKLFGLRSSLRTYRRNLLSVIASGRNLVEILNRGNKIGAPVGDKIRNGVGVPKWIYTRPELMRACLRGLMDSDGSVVLHSHAVRGHRYQHVELSYTSHCSSLLQDTLKLFHRLGFGAKCYPLTGHVALFRKNEIEMYAETIGTHNPTHKERYQLLRA